MSTPIWVASYPRSGNTLLRTILNHCFNQKTASIYDDDLAGNTRLADYVGHIERDGKRIAFPAGNLPLIKTHAYSSDPFKAIYVIRDVREVMASMMHFYSRSYTKEQILNDETPFGSWSDHIRSWSPLTRPETLLLRYEELTQDLPKTLKDLSQFLGLEIKGDQLPERTAMANTGGKHVRAGSRWQEDFTDRQLEALLRKHQDTLAQFGYA